MVEPAADIPLTEARWVRAVEMRPGTSAGRRITHHAIGYLLQEEPKTARARRPTILLTRWRAEAC